MASLEKEKRHYYDYCWFKSDLSNSTAIPNQDEIVQKKDGINAKTHSWLLPGEGLYINWSPKITT